MEEELTVYVGKDDDERKEDEDCCICLDKPATCVLIPCGHKACCNNDACKGIVKSHGKCPLCRTVFESMADLKLTVPTVQRQTSRSRFPKHCWPRPSFQREQEQGGSQSGWVRSLIRRITSEQQDIQRKRGVEDASICRLCFEEQAACTLFPCRHRACCPSPDCKRAVRNERSCPLCQSQVEAIADSQSQEFEVLQDRDQEEEQESEPLSGILWFRILFSFVLLFVTPFVLVYFLDRRFPDADYQERGGTFLVEGLKYHGLIFLFILLYVLSCGNCFPISMAALCLWPSAIFENHPGHYNGFRLAHVFKFFAFGLTTTFWPVSYYACDVNEKGRLKTFLRAILVSLVDNVFTAWLITLVLVSREFEQVDNSISDLCLLAGTMYSPFYCPLLVTVFPDLLVKRNSTKS